MDQPATPQQIFDCFFIVQMGPNGTHSRPLTFPSQAFSEKELQQCQAFCFPFDWSDPHAAGQRHQHFTFVLTDIDKRHRYGFCKLVDSGKQCYCFLSTLAWFEIFYKCLNCVRAIHCRDDMNTLYSLVEKIYSIQMPQPNEVVNISTSLTFSAPGDSILPSIPENRNMMEYFSSVPTKNMMEIFAALMFERRIIFTSSSLSILTGCVFAAGSLLFPLSWQHIFIPVLHQRIIDYCAAPMPFIIGVHSSLFKTIQKTAVIDGVVIVKIDSNVVETPYDDLHNMPIEPMSYLRGQLSKPNIAVGSNLSQVFLKTQARLIGGYRHALKFRIGEAIVFDDDKFIDMHKPGCRRGFAEVLVQLQTFRQFIESRLTMLNNGVGFHDAFENEVSDLQREGDNSSSVYKEWLAVTRKGGMFITNVKKHARSNMKNVMKPFMRGGHADGGVSRAHSLREDIQSIRPPRPPPPLNPPVKTVKRFKVIDEYDRAGGDASICEEMEVNRNTSVEMEGIKEDLLIDLSAELPSLPIGSVSSSQAIDRTNADIMKHFAFSAPTFERTIGCENDEAGMMIYHPNKLFDRRSVVTEAVSHSNEKNSLVSLSEKVSVQRQTAIDILEQPPLISFD